ncbi:MAG: hypothetical protein EXR76_04850 [Myxococcales bacterium]|nr:hypothetical protein [Myxococcales bacterium]
MKFLITKTVTAELEVQCENEDEARAWAGRIVATLEDGEGKPVELVDGMDFVAYSDPSGC